MKINLLSLMLVTMLGLLFLSCKKSEKNTEMDLDKNLIVSAEKYAKLMSSRTEETGSFTIEDVSRNGDILTISVKGGCTEEKFQMVWNGQILLSYPGQVHLVLHYNDEASCGTEHRFNIKINLKKILGKHDPKDHIFHVANGSLKQDKSLNPDGSVSSR